MSHYSAHLNSQTVDLTCQLCQQAQPNLDRLFKHIAFHQEQLALFALPSTEDEPGSEEDLSSDLGASEPEPEPEPQIERAIGPASEQSQNSLPGSHPPPQTSSWICVSIMIAIPIIEV